VKEVPVGLYAKAALEKLGVWPSVESKMAMTVNARAALSYVARGETPLGIVYATDANIEPGVKVVGLFPDNSNKRRVQAVARSFGLELHVLNASSERDFDAVFANLVQLRAGGLVIDASPLFISRAEQLAALAARFAVPTAFETPEFAAAGGLVSYSGSLTDSYRLAGVYTARILKGEKPWRAAGPAGHKSGALHQPQDRQGARYCRPASVVGPRRRAVRVKLLMSAFGGKADIARTSENVRF
jgi:hypothetical protein